MPEILTQAQIDEYNEVGAIVVHNVLSSQEVQRLRRVTDEMVEKSRAISTHTDIYDLEDTHSAAQPRVRRIKQPHIVDPAYGDLVRHPRILAALRDLWGPDIRFDTAKLNLKSAGYGAAVEWHQDWAFYPHTNDDVLAMGVLLDDFVPDNGPMMVGEALVCGVPVVAYPVGLPSVPWAEGMVGRVVEPVGDIPALAATIRAFAEMPAAELLQLYLQALAVYSHHPDVSVLFALCVQACMALNRRAAPVRHVSTSKNCGAV